MQTSYLDISEQSLPVLHEFILTLYQKHLPEFFAPLRCVLPIRIFAQTRDRRTRNALAQIRVHTTHHIIFVQFTAHKWKNSQKGVHGRREGLGANQPRCKRHFYLGTTKTTGKSKLISFCVAHTDRFIDGEFSGLKKAPNLNFVFLHGS